MMMDSVYPYFVLLFAITLCYFTLSAECRLFLSEISASPSPAPEAPTPPQIFSVFSASPSPAPEELAPPQIFSVFSASPSPAPEAPAPPQIFSVFSASPSPAPEAPAPPQIFSVFSASPSPAPEAPAPPQIFSVFSASPSPAHEAPAPPQIFNVFSASPSSAPKAPAPPQIFSVEISASPSPTPEAEAPPGPQIFSVLSYGAAGDGVGDDTQPFKMAWDAACLADVPAVILVPRHYTFMIQSAIFSGPCRNPLIFQIEGSIMAPEGPDSWPKNNSKRQWLVFYRIDGMRMQGGGVIDGRGQKWWDLPCKPHRGVNGTTLPGPCDSPVAIRFFWSSNLIVQGIKMKNSPQFHFRFDSCHHVHIDSLYIKSPAGSPNTDGIHVENSNNVNIYNSVIANGDDCVSIGAGTFNVDIRNITCGPGHGISIGSLGPKNTRACVSNITVRDSVIKHSDNGVRIKTWQGGYGAVSGISYSNIVMDTVRNPIMIDQYYCTTKSCSNQSSAVYISDVAYTSIKGTYDVRSPAMHLACSDAVACTNLTMWDVELLPAQGQKMVDPFCWNAYGDAAAVTIPPLLCLNQGSPLSLPTSDFGQC